LLFVVRSNKALAGNFAGSKTRSFRRILRLFAIFGESPNDRCRGAGRGLRNLVVALPRRARQILPIS
jgi:hypothetical protein